MESFPLQTTTTSRKKILKVIQDQNSQTMNSSYAEFATTAFSHLFYALSGQKCPFQRVNCTLLMVWVRQMGVPSSTLLSHPFPGPSAACIFWANWKCLSCHEWSTASPQEKGRIQSGQPFNNGMSTAHLQRERIWLLPLLLKEDLWLIIIQ